MAEYSAPEERTELPTARRMNQLRKEGAVFHSNDIAQLLTLITGFLVLSYTCGWLLSDLKIVYTSAFKQIAHPEHLSVQTVRAGFISLVILLGPPLALTIGLVGLVGVCAVGFQTGWCRRQPWVKFKWSFLDPIGGLKRIFSLMGFVNTAKSFLKLALILPIAFFALKSHAHEMLSMIHLSVTQIMNFTGTVMVEIFWRVCYVLIPLALFDLIWGKFQWLKRNKMTKQEVKDEQKSVEGDETIKRKIQAKGMQRLMQRIRSAVPQADVIVTNPTHYAVALKYDRTTMSAPIIVAKGKGFLALRIREIAKESGVPILERKSLARALYASVEVGAQIPYELFRAVAEVLAYVYRLKNPGRSQASVAGGK